MNIVDLGKFLNKLFKDLKINLYPIVAENSTVMPFATYERTSINHISKDYQVREAYYNINILSEQYEESVVLLQKVIDACLIPYNFNNECVRLWLENCSESYSDNYIQNITLNNNKLKIKKTCLL